MSKKPCNKRKKSPPAEEEMVKSVGSAHLKFDFDSQTLARVLVAFDNFSAEDVVHEDQDVSIRVTKKEYLDNAIKFSMTDIEKGSQARVTVHIYPGTQSMMVQGTKGKIMGKPPFISFTDIFLEPLLGRIKRNEKKMKR